MTIDEIHEKWANDAKIERDELADESMKIPQLHSKYLKIYSAERLKLKGIDFQHKELLRLKHEYYVGTISDEDLIERGWQPNPLKIMRSDIQMYIDADKDIIELLQKRAVQQEKVDLCNEILKSINTRGFQIKNAVDWIRFTNGA